jgi:hypothetical protein
VRAFQAKKTEQRNFKTFGCGLNDGLPPRSAKTWLRGALIGNYPEL